MPVVSVPREPRRRTTRVARGNATNRPSVEPVTSKPSWSRAPRSRATVGSRVEATNLVTAAANSSATMPPASSIAPCRGISVGLVNREHPDAAGRSTQAPGRDLEPTSRPIAR